MFIVLISTLNKYEKIMYMVFSDHFNVYKMLPISTLSWGITFMGDLRIDIPGLNMCLIPGCRVRLGRFQTTVWVVSHGWYSWGGNRPQCGWFLFDEANPSTVKPLQLPDLDDIYFVET